MDYRQQLLMDVQNEFVRFLDSKTIQDVIRVLTVELSVYELSPRNTEIAIRDKSSEQQIEYYAGCLLTAGRSKRTVYNYVRFLQRFLNDMNKDFIKITEFEILTWLAKAQKSITLRTCENYRSYLSAFYQWMIKKKIIRENPMMNITPVQYEEVIRQPFSEVQIDALRAACPNLRVRAELELLLSSGIRASELENMNRSDINFYDKSVFVRKGKGSKQRETYMNDICEHYLNPMPH